MDWILPIYHEDCSHCLTATKRTYASDQMLQVFEIIKNHVSKCALVLKLFELRFSPLRWQFCVLVYLVRGSTSLYNKNTPSRLALTSCLRDLSWTLCLLEFKFSVFLALYFEFGNDKGAANENEKYWFSNLLPLLKKFQESKKKKMENGIRDLKLLWYFLYMLLSIIYWFARKIEILYLWFFVFVTNREKFLCSPLPKPVSKIEPSAISFLGESMSEVM